MNKKTKNLLLFGGGLALLYFSGALGGTSSGYATYNPSTGTYTPGPQGFSGFGATRVRRIRRRLSGLAAAPGTPLPVPFLPNRMVNPSHRARYLP